jgi:DNA replication and repair protein RecF
LNDLSIEALEQEVWLIGGNGAGKTALIEAVYVLSRGVSFRGRRYGPIVQRGQPFTRVDGHLVNLGQSVPLRWTLGSDGQSQRYPSEIRHPFPVRLICEVTHLLVEGDPNWRRRFLDWNLSLVDSGSSHLFTRFRRLSGQRNAWLRDGGKGKAVWDEPYALALADIFRRRRLLFDSIAGVFNTLTIDFDGLSALQLRWEGPESDLEPLMTRLDAMLQGDIERGYSYLGPSRSDFLFEIDGRRWMGSRGQCKLTGILMQLAADQVVSDTSQQSSIWLIDDLDAELGSSISGQLIELLRSLDAQLFLTSLPGKQVLAFARESGAQMFHVEQV